MPSLKDALVRPKDTLGTTNATNEDTNQVDNAQYSKMQQSVL